MPNYVRQVVLMRDQGNLFVAMADRAPRRLFDDSQCEHGDDHDDDEVVEEECQRRLTSIGLLHAYCLQR